MSCVGDTFLVNLMYFVACEMIHCYTFNQIKRSKNTWDIFIFTLDHLREKEERTVIHCLYWVKYCTWRLNLFTFHREWNGHFIDQVTTNHSHSVVCDFVRREREKQRRIELQRRQFNFLLLQQLDWERKFTQEETVTRQPAACFIFQHGIYPEGWMFILLLVSLQHFTRLFPNSLRREQLFNKHEKEKEKKLMMLIQLSLVKWITHAHSFIHMNIF